jgi:hypothetical protein
LAGERCDRNLGGSDDRTNRLAANLAFFRDVFVRSAGFHRACGIDEENCVRTREVCGILLPEIPGGWDRNWLADVPVLALKVAYLAKYDPDLNAAALNIFPVARTLHLL